MRCPRLKVASEVIHQNGKSRGDHQHPREECRIVYRVRKTEYSRLGKHALRNPADRNATREEHTDGSDHSTAPHRIRSTYKYKIKISYENNHAHRDCVTHLKGNTRGIRTYKKNYQGRHEQCNGTGKALRQDGIQIPALDHLVIRLKSEKEGCDTDDEKFKEEEIIRSEGISRTRDDREE